MRSACGFFRSIVLIAAFTIVARGQQAGAGHGTPPANNPTSEHDKPLVLTEAIPLENAKGRFDHFAIGGRILDHIIMGVPDPQGIAFSPETNRLFVASGRGKVYIYDGTSYDQVATVDFEGGADNLRYDAATKRIYVGCGDDDKTGAIAMIDATTNQRLNEEYKLGGEPESLQLEKSGPNIYVNVPRQ